MAIENREAFAELEGKKIVEVKVGPRREWSGGPLMIILDDGSVIEVSEDGRPGVHYEWDNGTQVKHNDRIIYRS